MKKIMPVLIAVVLIVLIGGITFGPKLYEKYSYSHERADLYEYFNVMSENEAAIVLQDKLIEEKAIVQEGRYYFELETVHEYLNDRFYIDEIEQLLIYTTPTDIIRTAIGSTEYSVNGEPTDAGYCISYTKTAGEDTVYYIAADFVKAYTAFSYEAFENPYRIQVYTEWPEQTAAEVKKDTSVRVLGGVKSPILRDLAHGEKVTVLDKMETWCKVKTEDAFIGYVENKYLENERTEAQQPPENPVSAEYTALTREEKISLGWHAIYAKSGNDTLGTMLANAPGMTVVAPTWFSVKDEEGNIQSFAQSSYVEKAHQNGVEVWGVIDDFNYEGNNGIVVDVPAVLASTTKRTALIDNLMKEALSCGMDGINIDFEKVNDAKTGENFVQFLRELSIRCRANNLVLSVANYVPYNFNAQYDLEEQGIVADYVIVMAYDEHWAGSPEAGSVSSIDYVRYGIEKTCEMVPSNKIVVALPFYTRLWKTNGTTVTSEAYPMTGTDGVLAAYGMTAQWDENTSQNYAETMLGDTLYQIWIEDIQSLTVKLNVMRNYDLGGVAAWRLGYEPASVWELFKAYTQQ